MVQNGAKRGRIRGRVVQGVRFRVHLSGESGQIYSDLLRFGQMRGGVGKAKSRNRGAERLRTADWGLHTVVKN